MKIINARMVKCSNYKLKWTCGMLRHMLVWEVSMSKEKDRMHPIVDCNVPSIWLNLLCPTGPPYSCRNHPNAHLSNYIRKTPHLLFCAFSCFFYFFHKKVEKAQKKSSAALARVLSKAVKKVYCLQKYFRSKNYSQKITSSDKMEVVSVILHEKI